MRVMSFSLHLSDLGYLRALAGWLLCFLLIIYVMSISGCAGVVYFCRSGSGCAL